MRRPGDRPTVATVPMKTPDLRVASPDDVTFLARVVFLTHEERYATRPGWDPEAFYRGLLEDAADQVTGGPQGSTTYVIMDGQERVGRLRAVRTPERIEIAGLQIRPDRQGRGIGTAIIERVFHEADANALPVVLDVDIDNPRAQALYERLGFAATACIDHDRRRMVRASR